MNSELLSEWSAITEQNLLSWSWTVNECWVWRGKGKHEHKVHSKLHWWKKNENQYLYLKKFFICFYEAFSPYACYAWKLLKNMLTIKSNHFHFIFVRIVKSGKPSVNVLRMNMFFFYGEREIVGSLFEIKDSIKSLNISCWIFKQTNADLGGWGGSLRPNPSGKFKFLRFTL